MPELRRPTLVLFSRANPVSAILTKLTAGHMALIYKIVSRAEWEAAAKVGTYNGSQVDMADGFIHFSTGAQMRETAAKHFAGQPGLVLVSFDGNAFGDKLVYEPSRGGALFPHLHAPLATSLALAVVPLPLGSDGQHIFPEDAA